MNVTIILEWQYSRLLAEVYPYPERVLLICRVVSRFTSVRVGILQTVKNLIIFMKSLYSLWVMIKSMIDKVILSFDLHQIAFSYNTKVADIETSIRGVYESLIRPERATGAVITDWRPEDPAFCNNAVNVLPAVTCGFPFPVCSGVLRMDVVQRCCGELTESRFNFTTDQLFMLTALPSVSGAYYVFHTPLWFLSSVVVAGRLQHRYSDYSLRLAGFCRAGYSTPYSVFIIISLLCGFAGANSHPVWQTSASSFRNRSRVAPGSEWWSGKHGRQRHAVGCSLVVSLSIFAVFGSQGVKQPEGLSCIWRMRPGYGCRSLPSYHCGVVWHERSCYLESLHQGQLPVLKRGHLWIMSLLYLATSAPLSASPRALRCCQKRSSRCSDSAIRFLRAVYWCAGAFAGGALSDRLGGTRVTLVNFI